MGIRFGVEIETHMPVGSCDRGPHGRGRQVAWLPPGWLADADPSIVAPNTGRFGVEFVSPILDGPDGMRQLQSAVAEIKARGGQVNASCGLHVHVDFDKSNTPAVAKLIRLVANHEQALRLYVSKALHGLCPLGRPVKKPTFSTVGRRRLLRQRSPGPSPASGASAPGSAPTGARA